MVNSLRDTTRFQASAAKKMRNALFWATTQKEFPNYPLRNSPEVRSSQSEKLTAPLNAICYRKDISQIHSYTVLH